MLFEFEILSVLDFELCPVDYDINIKCNDEECDSFIEMSYDESNSSEV